MYFIFEMEFNTNKTYMTKLIRAFAEKFDIEPDVMQGDEKITLIFRQGDPQIEHFLTELNDLLPASIFFGKSHYYTADKKPQPERVNEVPLPCNLSLCPSCQKEMFDVSSSRYYYPFTSCNNCGGQYPFVTQYPYKRENSTMKFMIPCAACENERSTNPLRKGYALISCVECGIPLRMNDGKSVRYANDKGSYRKLFEVSAAALAKGKSVLIKTVNGYRKFFQPTQEMSLQHTTLMVTEAPALNRHMMMITQEFNALLSIERPLVRVATKSDEMKALYGTTVLVKYPDDGMSMLLARELLNIGLEYVAYEVAEESTPADFLVDFDLPVEPQRDATLFINQDDKFFISGERIIFPSTVDGAKDVVSIAHNLATVTVDDTLISDSRDRFHDVKTSRINVLESEPFESSHSQVHRFRQWEASMLSVLADHHALNEKAIGVHFDSALSFLYYNGQKVINVVPPNPFEADYLFDRIAALRDGSERLVENYRKRYPEVAGRLETLSGNVDIFTVVAIMLGLKDESLEGISAEALSFLGKGGIQIDTHVKDNRFDNYAFVASIMSYQLGGVENPLICYSIYESFGDYVSELVSQLTEKTKARNVTFTGETFANQALYARIHRHIGGKNLLFPIHYPIGKESAVFGALYLP